MFADGRALLQRIIDGKLLTARATYGFFPAHREGDDVVAPTARFPMMRQQEDKDVCLSLADFIAPADADITDYLGAFIVTAGHGVDELSATFLADHDDYNSIMVKVLADRLAEAAAEWLHARARRDWGYGADEQLSREQILAEKYRGIRPAFGYPACPDHAPKGTLFALLGNARAPRRDAHGWPRDAADRVGVGPVLRALPTPATSRSAASAAIRSPTTPRAWACRSSRSSAWSRRTWRTDRRLL